MESNGKGYNGGLDFFKSVVKNIKIMLTLKGLNFYKNYKLRVNKKESLLIICFAIK